MADRAQQGPGFDKLRNELQKSVLLREAARLQHAQLRANTQVLRRKYDEAKRLDAELRRAVVTRVCAAPIPPAMRCVKFPIPSRPLKAWPTKTNAPRTDAELRGAAAPTCTSLR